ncbi:MAG: hypothetical protein NTY04_02580 [Candidatus Staskawiczbacteria bacterium]|nr:hypothetical protein [Candidatus Staskawiczbacteria bacterium]
MNWYFKFIGDCVGKNNTCKYGLSRCLTQADSAEIADSDIEGTLSGISNVFSHGEIHGPYVSKQEADHTKVELPPGCFEGTLGS